MTTAILFEIGGSQFDFFDGGMGDLLEDWKLFADETNRANNLGQLGSVCRRRFIELAGWIGKVKFRGERGQGRERR